MRGPLKFKPIQTERYLEGRLVEDLEKRGIEYRRQCPTPCGRADVVTEDTVYEVKTVLIPEFLFKAFGQVTLYAAALGKPRRVIVGYPAKGCEHLYELVRAQGVEINVVP